MMDIKPLAECTVDDLENRHAFVYGRVRIWTPKTDAAEFEWRWSKHAWWKAMWYSHRGGPMHSRTWGVYAGEGFTGPGDAELTHFIRMPPVPTP